MAKTKNRKKGLSDLRNEANQRKKKTLNPFEVHVNRQKFDVLGRKLKTDRGLPGLSRAKAIKKRKETLLQEYKVLGKSNKFVDRRIGEFNKDMTAEDKIMARFAAERASSQKKKAMFNLAEDEPLTHKGRSIMELETFEDPPSDDDDIFDRKLDGTFVEEAHFGGGMLKNAEGSRMAVIDQLIAESKKRKAEKAAAKEHTLAATEKLDNEWKDLLPVLTAGKPENEDASKKDEYDQILGQLRFEPRGTPSDRLKSEVEIAEEEAKRLRELEEERIRRMTGDVPSVSKSSTSKHRSADDLDDGFDLSGDEDEDYILTYDKEGRPVGLPEDATKQISRADSDGEEGSGDESDEEEDGSEDDDFADLKEDDKPDEEEPDLESHREEKKRLLKRKVDESESKPIETSLDKKKIRVESNGIGKTEEMEKTESLPTKKKVSFSSDVNMVSYDSEELPPRTVEELNKERKRNEKLLKTARSELPFTFLVPDEYEEFEELLKGRTLVEQVVIVERMIKCTHPSLKEGNRAKLETLFTFILQKLNDSDYSEIWSTLDTFAPYLFDLTQFSPRHAADSLCEVIHEKFSDCLKKKHHYPYPDTLVFLKLVPLLFPPSDKRHQVTTPALTFILFLLHSCRPNTRRGITTGLFLCALLTQYVNLSKRIAPEVLSFLNGVLWMASIKMNSDKSKIVPPFRAEYKLLCLESDMSSYQGSCKMLFSDLGSKGNRIDDEFRVKAVFSAVTSLQTFCAFYADKPAVYLLFEPIHCALKSFHVGLSQTVLNIEPHDSFNELKSVTVTKKKVLERYPSQVKRKLEDLLGTLNEMKQKPLSPLVKDAARPKYLRTYEPNIKPVFDKDKIKDERIRLKRRLKKETKGALREIRKDRTFLAGVRFKEQKASDMERIRKVKEIYGFGAQQQGELNKLDRIKKRKKFGR